MLGASRPRMGKILGACERERVRRGRGERKGSEGEEEFPDLVPRAIEERWSAKKLYDEIDAKLPLLLNVWRDTIHYSAQSGVWSTVILKILSGGGGGGGGGNGGWETGEVMSDMANLLSRCEDVFSAEIAELVGEIGGEIWKEERGGGEEGKKMFSDMDREEAVEWLKERKEIWKLVERYNFVFYCYSFLFFSFLFFIDTEKKKKKSGSWKPMVTDVSKKQN